VILATAREIITFDHDGRKTYAQRAAIGVSAVAFVENDRPVIGYGDGNMDLGPRRLSSSVDVDDSFSFEGVPSSSVVKILAGPMRTVVAGYANGFVGIWSLSNGRLLHHVQLHGPVVHLLLQDRKLFAATELGDYSVVDLSVFSLAYCDLLNDIWSRVPVVWRNGLPWAEARPTRHACAEK
jgi:hypothetical protein